MTKYTEKLKELIERWYENRTMLAKEDYEMLKDLCNEVYKETPQKTWKVRPCPRCNKVRRHTLIKKTGWVCDKCGDANYNEL